MSHAIFVFDISIGENLGQTDISGSTWPGIIRQRNISDVQSASGTKRTVSGMSVL